MLVWGLLTYSRQQLLKTQYYNIILSLRICVSMCKHTDPCITQFCIGGQFLLFQLGSNLAAIVLLFMPLSFLSLMQRRFGTTQRTKHNGRHDCFPPWGQHATTLPFVAGGAFHWHLVSGTVGSACSVHIQLPVVFFYVFMMMYSLSESLREWY